MTRALKRAVGRALIALLLFAQMVVAAYACPRMAPHGTDWELSAAATSADVTAAGAEDRAADMPIGCDGAAIDSPNLCAAHCQAGDQNTDTTHPIVPASVLSSFYVVPIPSAPSELNRNRSPAAAINTIPPPHAILHCCFRI